MDIFVNVFIPLFIPFLTFVFGIFTTTIYNHVKTVDHAYKYFYIPLIKDIIIKNLLCLSAHKLTSEQRISIEDLMTLSFENLHHMNKKTQIKFMSFCSLWLSYQKNSSVENLRSLLSALRLYLEAVLKEANKNAKIIRKSLPITVTSWAINYMNDVDDIQ